MLQKLFEFILPERCVNCFDYGSSLCLKCKELCCFKPRLESLDSLKYFDAILSCYEYRNPIIRKVISYFKFRYIHSLGETLGKILFLAWKEKFGDRKTSVCFVPLHKRRQNARGFNQSKLLAEAFCKASRFELCDCLERNKFDIPQSKLNRKERMNHLNGHFSIKEGVALPETIILIDDVATTLSTMKECAKILKGSGVKTVVALVLARA